MINNGLLLLNKKHAETLIEQTKRKPQETVENNLNNQTQTFFFPPPIKYSEEGKCLLAVPCFEVTISVFNTTHEKNRFSITTPDHWNSKSAKQIIDKLHILLERRSQVDIELHVKPVRKKDVISMIDFSLSSLGTFKN